MIDKEYLARLEMMADLCTSGPWEVQTGCSWRRIGSAGKDGNVLCPTNHPVDGHPDLSSADGNRENNLALMAESRTAIPALVKRVRQLEGEVACLKTEIDNNNDEYIKKMLMQRLK